MEGRRAEQGIKRRRRAPSPNGEGAKREGHKVFREAKSALSASVFLRAARRISRPSRLTHFVRRGAADDPDLSRPGPVLYCRPFVPFFVSFRFLSPLPFSASFYGRMRALWGGAAALFSNRKKNLQIAATMSLTYDNNYAKIRKERSRLRGAGSARSAFATAVVKNKTDRRM